MIENSTKSSEFVEIELPAHMVEQARLLANNKGIEFDKLVQVALGGYLIRCKEHKIKSQQRCKHEASND